MRIPFIRPTVPPVEEWERFLAASYQERRFSNFGPAHRHFEQALTGKYGRGGREAVLMSSGTAGLVAALLALKVKGKVAMPAFTFSATAHAVFLAGCRPLFCDVDPDTWELNPSALEEMLRRERVGAILLVRPFGFARDLGWAERLGRAYGVPIIVDSAAGLGGLLDNGTPVGNQGTIEVFSLHVTKVFGIGEGGVGFCSGDLARTIRQIINFGLEGGSVASRGFNGKMSDFAAAVGLAVLGRIDRFIQNRQAYAERYRRGLAPLEEAGILEFPRQPGRYPIQCFPVRVGHDAPEGAEVVRVAATRGVELKCYYVPPLHQVQAFQGKAASAVRLPETERLSGRVVCLPVYSVMESQEIDFVVETVRAILRPPSSAA